MLHYETLQMIKTKSLIYSPFTLTLKNQSYLSLRVKTSVTISPTSDIAQPTQVIAESASFEAVDVDDDGAFVYSVMNDKKQRTET